MICSRLLTQPPSPHHDHIPIGVSPEDVYVLFNGRPLEEADLLSAAGVEEAATLNVLGRLLGGAKKRKKKTYTKPKKQKHKHKKIKLRVLKFYKVRRPRWRGLEQQQRQQRQQQQAAAALDRDQQQDADPATHPLPPPPSPPRSTTLARSSACASSAPSAAPAPSWPRTLTASTAASAPPPTWWRPRRPRARARSRAARCSIGSSARAGRAGPPGFIAAVAPPARLGAAAARRDVEGALWFRLATRALCSLHCGPAHARAQHREGELSSSFDRG
jgi:hypothetical protein